jgi:hypothetical protein
MRYDSGDFPAVLEEALAAADWDGFAARRAESRARGKLRGIGIGQYLEVTAPPSKEMGGIRFDEDGGVTVLTGTLDYGQGHASPFAQVLVDRLGIPFDRIRLSQGDSDLLVAGGGTGGSRSIMASGTALSAASALVVEKGKRLAAHVLEASAADIEFSAGRFGIVGTDRGIGILDLAARVRAMPEPPDGLPRTLDVSHTDQYEDSAFPNGCHVAEVEIDPDTGETAVVGYATVNDFGVLVNPMLVAGQAHGGIVQGIGQALTELTAYDEGGQPLSGSFMDYGLPRADHVPFFGFASHPRSRAHQRAGREGLRRGGVRGRAAVRDERGRGCAGGARRGACRHARDAAEGLGPAERGRRGIAALVIGTTTGFGVVTARRSAQDGARVTAAGRHAGRLEVPRGEWGRAAVPNNGDGREAAQLASPNAADLVRPPPVPARGDPACGVAVSTLHAELPGRRGSASRARARRVRRDGPALVPEVRAGHRPAPWAGRRGASVHSAVCITSNLSVIWFPAAGCPPSRRRRRHNGLPRHRRDVRLDPRRPCAPARSPWRSRPTPGRRRRPPAHGTTLR